MGRTFENRKHAMAKRGDRDAKAFTRAGRHISMAVRAGGGDPDGNPALRRAIQNARAVSMPKDRIQAAIDKAMGLGDGDAFQSILYEGYGPHGIAILVDTTTDNPTRTVANVRLAFKKGNGNLGNSGSVSFLFDHFGFFRLSPEGINREELELEFIDHGLEQLEEGEADDGSPVLVLRCSRESFGKVQSALDERGIEPVSSGFEWIPKDSTTLPDDQAEEVMALIERLEQDDDVQQVFATLD
ncbi:MAG: YebC/PmpR family DNA-binding transcriptional regulator [Deltaproteobacteria bacterium]|nr:YebC/PmpR family DNA-binding transcriptional regulator [Deltaproteobacteria bacterium]